MNVYDVKNRQFVRYFYRGASKVTTDGSERILFPKRLMAYGNLTKEVVLFAYNDRIEVWDKETYDNLLTDEPDEFAVLAEEVMGGAKNQEEDGVS